jgi:AcrR family transcriptional regulator
MAQSVASGSGLKARAKRTSQLKEAAQTAQQLGLAKSDHGERIIGAVLELAAEGGYEAVQIVEIARRAEVSSRTIYNHYGSKDNVLVAAMKSWRHQVAAQLDTAPNIPGFEMRMLAIYRQIFEAFAKYPLLFETFVRMPWKRDPTGWEWELDVVDSAVGAELPDLDRQFAEDFRRIVGAVLLAGFTRRGTGQFSSEEVWSEIERCIRRLARCIDLHEGVSGEELVGSR